MEISVFQRIKNGDQQAFELLYRRYFATLCGFANKFLHDNELAEETVQEVFLNIWKNRKDLKTNHSEKSYLFQAIQNRSFNQLDKLKNRDKYQDVLKVAYSDVDEFNAHDSLLAKELSDKIDQSIKKLPEQCRNIFMMSRHEGKKYREIADDLNISVKTVETQMNRALKSLRTDLKDYLSIIIVALITSN